MVQKSILTILKGLQYKLGIGITMQQNTLKKTKSEVEKNLTGTPELLQISET